MILYNDEFYQIRDVGYAQELVPIKYKVPILTIDPYFYQNVFLWLDNNNIKYESRLIRNLGSSFYEVVFGFETVSDAILFKLTWA